MMIMGIRSFDNTRGEVIRFHTPLTLIVGFNGSGKTTIIECLKYATTGLPPPNSKGGSFIHDPKLAGEKEVMAQVKLSFKDTQGSKVVITRSQSATSKKGGSVSVKALDSNLMVERNGERTSVSHKTNDINKPVIEYLGVSPAILDNVIFCHQDESLWPMSDPGTLKKKFDEIFDAEKYTKAVAHLKILRKQKWTEMANFEKDLESEKINKERADKLKKKIQDLLNIIDRQAKEVEDINEDITAAADMKVRKHRDAERARTVVRELQTKQDQAEYKRQNIAQLQSYIEELQDSDEWLEATLAQYSARVAEFKKTDHNYTVQYHELNKSLSELRSRMFEKQSEKGQCQAQEEAQEKNIERRAELVKEAAHRHSVRGYEGELDSDQVQDFISRIGKVSREKDRELERVRKAAADEVRQAQSELTNLEQRRSFRTKDKNDARQAIDKNEKEASEKQKEMKSLPMDEGKQAALEMSLKDVQEQLQKTIVAYESEAWDEKLEQENTRLSELKNESIRLFDELSQTTQQSDSRAQLVLAKKNLNQEHAKLNALKATRNNELVSAIGVDWRIENVEQEYGSIAEQRDRTVEDIRRQRDEAKDNYNRAEFQFKAVRDEVKGKRDTMQKHEATVVTSIEIDEKPLSSVDDHPIELKSLEMQRDECRSNLEGADYVSRYYKDFLKHAKDNNACQLCLRPFASGKEQSAAVHRIDQKLAKITKELYEEELKLVEDDLQKAITARPQYDAFVSLRGEIPALEKKLTTLEASKDASLARLENYDSLLSEAQSAKRDVDALADNVRAISHCLKDIHKFEADVTRLSSQQSLTGSSRSIDEIQEQKTGCDERIRALDNKIVKINRESEKMKTVRMELEKQVEATSRKLESAGHILEKKQFLLSRVEELRGSTAHLRDNIRQADDDLGALGPEIDRAKMQLDKVQDRGRAKENEISKEQSVLKDTVHKLENIELSIKNYIEGGGPDKLKSCQHALDIMEQKEAGIEKDMVSITKETSELRARIADSDKTERSMKDNVRYRQERRELKQLQDEIADLKSRNVEDDYAKLNREANDATTIENDLISKRNILRAKISAQNEELNRYDTEFETDFKDAGTLYRKALIKLTTTKAVVDDLVKCTKAVDTAIIKYHAHKMQEINDFAGELWQKTYQGTDIDTIMIRSENDDSSTVNRNTYNYRVVMVKQDTEMDMRGRCSAGQRVLACIIIRLALAECFGVNCGIIALDEPTTNLDQDNIQALADALHGIIQSRKHQRNFQLVVITHDEDFLKHMKCSDFTEYYYRVSRDDRQKSVIERQSIMDIMG